MKAITVLLSILLSLTVITKTMATAQAPEILEYDGKRVAMFEEPLWPYHAAINKLNTSTVMSTNCWRGYVGEWKIENNKLLLVKINTGSGEIPLHKLFRPWYIRLFKKDSVEAGPIFASWYSGVIRVPQGKLLQYVHMGYESIYESELMLLLSKGVLVGQFTIDNTKPIETNLKSFDDAKEKFKQAIADDQELRENIDSKISMMKEELDTSADRKAAIERKVKIIREAAERGDREAQYNFGILYWDGNYIEKNRVKSIEWYQKSADQGYIPAQCNLGVIYYAEKNFPKAIELFRKADAQGNPHAQHNLGLCYANGNGVTKDEVEAVKWFRKAAEQGLPDAEYELGDRYANGTGVPIDMTKAMEWYSKAATHGHYEAKKKIKSSEK